MKRINILFFLCASSVLSAQDYSLTPVLAPLALRSSAPLMPYTSPFQNFTATSTPETIAYNFNQLLVPNSPSKRNIFIAALSDGEFRPVQEIKLGRFEVLHSLRILGDQFLRIEVSQSASDPKREDRRYRFIDLLTYEEIDPDRIFRSQNFDLVALSDTLYAAKPRRPESRINFFSYDPTQEKREGVKLVAENSKAISWEPFFRFRSPLPIGLDYYPRGISLNTGRGEGLILNPNEVTYFQNQRHTGIESAHSNSPIGKIVGNVLGTHNIKFALNDTQLSIFDNGRNVSTQIPAGAVAAIIQRLNEGYYVTLARTPGTEGMNFEGIHVNEFGRKRFIQLPRNSYSAHRIVSSLGLTATVGDLDDPNQIRLHYAPFLPQEKIESYRQRIQKKRTAHLLNKDVGFQTEAFLKKLRTLGLLGESHSINEVKLNRLELLARNESAQFLSLLEEAPVFSANFWATLLIAIDSDSAEKLWAERIVAFIQDPKLDEKLRSDFLKLLNSSKISYVLDSVRPQWTLSSASTSAACECTCKLGQSQVTQ